MIEFDKRMRVVSYANLEQMVARAQKPSMRFELELTARRVLLRFYLQITPVSTMTHCIRLPLLPSGDDKNPLVVFWIVSDFGQVSDVQRRNALDVFRQNIFAAPALTRDKGGWRAE